MLCQLLGKRKGKSDRGSGNWASSLFWVPAAFIWVKGCEPKCGLHIALWPLAVGTVCENYHSRCSEFRKISALQIFTPTKLTQHKIPPSYVPPTALGPMAVPPGTPCPMRVPLTLTGPGPARYSSALKWLKQFQEENPDDQAALWLERAIHARPNDGSESLNPVMLAGQLPFVLQYSTDLVRAASPKATRARASVGTMDRPAAMREYSSKYAPLTTQCGRSRFRSCVHAVRPHCRRLVVWWMAGGVGGGQKSGFLSFFDSGVSHLTHLTHLTHPT